MSPPSSRLPTPRLAFAVLLFLHAVAPVAAQFALRPLAMTGDALPGDASSHFASFEIPVLNDEGQAAFVADLQTTNGLDLLAGVFSTGPDTGAGALQTIVRQGDAWSDALSGVAFHWFREFTLNSRGDLAFRAVLAGDGVTFNNRTAILTRPLGAAPGEFRVVAREGDLAPGADGLRFVGGGLGAPQLNDRGGVAFFGALTSFAGANEAIYTEAGSENHQLRLAARERTTTPINHPEVSLVGGGLFSRRPAINNAGQTAFHSSLVGNGADNFGLLLEEPDESGGGQLNLVGARRSGGSGPGLLMNDAGQIVIYNNGSIATSVLEGDSRVYRPVASSGDTPVDRPEMLYRNFGSPQLNEAGQIVHRVSLSGPDAIVLHEPGAAPGNARVVAQEGMPAPGLPEGSGFSHLGGALLNDTGHMLVTGRVTIPDEG